MNQPLPPPAPRSSSVSVVGIVFSGLGVIGALAIAAFLIYSNAVSPYKTVTGVPSMTHNLGRFGLNALALLIGGMSFIFCLTGLILGLVSLRPPVQTMAWLTLSLATLGLIVGVATMVWRFMVVMN